MPTFKELTDYFQEIGATGVEHSNKSYLAHAIGVYNGLKAWGCDENLARVGLFHSIYGTQIFQGFTLPLERRDEIRDLIGDRAERISWLNCAIDRHQYDQELKKASGPYQILDRFTDTLVDVSDDDFRDLCIVHLYDWIEQVARAESWNYRRTAYCDLADRLGGRYRDDFHRIFADAPEQVAADEYEWPEVTSAE